MVGSDVFPMEMVNFWGDMLIFRGFRIIGQDQWVINYLLRLIIVVYWDYNPFTNHFLTSWDIHVGPLLLLMAEILLYNQLRLLVEIYHSLQATLDPYHPRDWYIYLFMCLNFMVNIPPGSQADY